MKKGFVLLVLTIAITACQKDTHVEYRIDNQTSGVITVTGWNYGDGLPINTSIKYGDYSQIAIWSERELVTDPYDPSLTLGNDLVIKNANGVTTTKNYLITENWTVDIQNDKKSADHIYTLTITSSDF